MFSAPHDYNAADVRAGFISALPVLAGVMPFGLITGVAMAAGGIPPLEACLMSVIAFAGASQLAATQLLGSSAPVAVIFFTTLFINLRFMMYSASLRQHLRHLPWGWKLLAGYFLSDNCYALCIGQFSRAGRDKHPLWFFFGAALPVWMTWQIGTIVGVLAGAAVPAAWRLEFAAPLAFVALSVPLLRDRGMVAAALAAGLTAALATALPMRSGMVLAAIAGIAAGLLFEKRTT